MGLKSTLCCVHVPQKYSLAVEKIKITFEVFCMDFQAGSPLALLFRFVFVPNLSSTLPVDCTLNAVRFMNAVCAFGAAIEPCPGRTSDAGKTLLFRASEISHSSFKHICAENCAKHFLRNEYEIYGRNSHGIDGSRSLSPLPT